LHNRCIYKASAFFQFAYDVKTGISVSTFDGTRRFDIFGNPLGFNQSAAENKIDCLFFTVIFGMGCRLGGVF